MNLCPGNPKFVSDLLAGGFLAYVKIEHSLGKTRFGSVLGLVLCPVSAILKVFRKNQGVVPANDKEKV